MSNTYTNVLFPFFSFSPSDIPAGESAGETQSSLRHNRSKSESQQNEEKWVDDEDSSVASGKGKKGMNYQGSVIAT